MQPGLTEQPMNMREAAQFLSMKYKGLAMNIFRFNETDKQRIPHYKAPNGRIYFYASELNEWIQSGNNSEEDNQPQTDEGKQND